MSKRKFVHFLKGRKKPFVKIVTFFTCLCGWINQKSSKINWAYPIGFKSSLKEYFYFHSLAVILVICGVSCCSKSIKSHVCRKSSVWLMWCLILNFAWKQKLMHGQFASKLNKTEIVNLKSNVLTCWVIAFTLKTVLFWRETFGAKWPRSAAMFYKTLNSSLSPMAKEEIR